jgi:hypothetical protein
VRSEKHAHLAPVHRLQVHGRANEHNRFVHRVLEFDLALARLALFLLLVLLAAVVAAVVVAVDAGLVGAILVDVFLILLLLDYASATGRERRVNTNIFFARQRKRELVPA